jgi:hypothetical protein
MAKVSTFKKSFEDEFGVTIKCHKGMSRGHFAEDDDKMHEICTGMDHDRDIGLHGRMKVSTVEKEIADSMGFAVQILNPDGSNADNSATLSELRRAHA